MRRAFTLLEIVFVLGLIAVLISIILPSFKGIQDESKFTKARTELSILQAALEQYYHKTKEFPAETTDYQQDLINETSFFNKPYLDPFNPTSTTYEYHAYSSGTKKFYLIISPGLNRGKELDPDNNGSVDIIQGTVVLPAGSDDLIVTNLKILE